MVDISSWIEQEQIRWIEIYFTTLRGTLAHRRVSADTFPERADRGYPVQERALSGQAPNVGSVVPDSDRTAFLKPDIDTLTAIPWRNGVASAVGDLHTPQGKPHPLCSRGALKQAVDRIHDWGGRPQFGTELEFFLLDPETRRPLFEGVQNYSLYRGSFVQDVVGQAVEDLKPFGCVIEVWHPEYGSSQIEFNLRYTDAIAMADQVALSRKFIRQIAREHDLFATFMPKPWLGESSNGLHFHQSLWSPDGDQNLFYSQAEDGINQQGEYYLGGLLQRMKECTALGSPTPNAYKRRVDLSFAPTRLCWGGDNRTLAIRVIEEGPGGTRIEQRDASSDANPYLAMAAQIMAGLEGVQEQIEPGPRTEGNAYDPAKGLEELPRTMDQGIDQLENSEFVRRAFGDTLIDAYLEVLHDEQRRYKDQVTQWERDRYMEAM